MSKLRILRLNDSILREMFTEGIKGPHEIVTGIPSDAEIVNVRHGWPNGIEIILRSESFDPAWEGHPVPSLNIVVRKFALKYGEYLAVSNE